MADINEELKQVDNDIHNIEVELRKLTERKELLVRRKEDLKSKLNEQTSLELASQDWENTNFPWTKQLFETLLNIFHIGKFRTKQLSAINASMKGHDVILIMPTGGGKSLCYQLPALVSEGITLVVSPLVSLMEDQLLALKKLNINSALLNANSTKEEVNAVHNAMTDKKSDLKLIYVTPEKLAKSKRFMAKVQKMFSLKRFARLAIDEVHCCSQWGHDFRPDYKFLGVMRSLFPGVPILGLTATATSRVTADVQKILNLKSCLIFKASFNRPNLYYEVRSKPPTQKECVDELANILQNRFAHQSGIIYATSVKECDELARELRQRKLKVASYHANLEPERRSQVHTRWLNNEYQAVVATIAFGMGIDKPDVRFVVHHSISKSMENFYQESGRAGRDDKLSYCIVYWRLADLFKLSTMVFAEQTGLQNLYSVAAYCIDLQSCRRQVIAGHFDERWDAGACRNMCDHCNSSVIMEDIDISHHLMTLRKIFHQASVQDIRLTAQKLLDAWMNKGPANLRLSGNEAIQLRRETCEHVITYLLLEGYLKEDFHFTPYSTISYLVLGDRAGAIGEEIEIFIKMKSAVETKISKKNKTTSGRSRKKQRIECVTVSSTDSE